VGESVSEYPTLLINGYCFMKNDKYEYLRYVLKFMTWFALLLLTLITAKDINSLTFVLSLGGFVLFTWYILTRDV